MPIITIENIQINHREHKLDGRIYRTVGDTHKPSVIICIGYPGDTKHMDLAEELALNNINVLIFYYSGAWGSEGTYSFTNLVSSTQSAIEWLIQQPYTDPLRIALISHSMGSIPLTKILSKENRVKTGVLISPASDITSWRKDEKVEGIFPEFKNMAESKLVLGDDGEFKSSMIFAGVNLNPVDNVRKITVPLMIIVGSIDKVTTPDSCRYLFDSMNEPKQFILVNGADHEFSEHRIPLQKTIIEWLKIYL